MPLAKDVLRIARLAELPPNSVAVKPLWGSGPVPVCPLLEPDPNPQYAWPSAPLALSVGQTTADPLTVDTLPESRLVHVVEAPAELLRASAAISPYTLVLTSAGL